MSDVPALWLIGGEIVGCCLFLLAMELRHRCEMRKMRREGQRRLADLTEKWRKQNEAQNRLFEQKLAQIPSVKVGCDSFRPSWNNPNFCQHCRFERIEHA